jgi:hypothetical protein
VSRGEQGESFADVGQCVPCCGGQVDGHLTSGCVGRVDGGCGAIEFGVEFG